MQRQERGAENVKGSKEPKCKGEGKKESKGPPGGRKEGDGKKCRGEEVGGAKFGTEGGRRRRREPAEKAVN